MNWRELDLLLAVMTPQILLSYRASSDIVTIVLFRAETRCLAISGSSRP